MQVDPRLGVAAALALLTACSGSAPRPQPSAAVVVVPLRHGEVAQHTAPVRNGHVRLQPLTARCGITSVTGTHAEFTPRRPVCRVRIRVVSDDAAYHSVSPLAQRLVLGDGRALPASTELMSIARQPERVELGAHDAAEFDVWWEPPLGASARGLRLVGDADPDPAGVSVGVRSGPRSGVEVPLTLR